MTSVRCHCKLPLIQDLLTQRFDYLLDDPADRVVDIVEDEFLIDRVRLHGEFAPQNPTILLAYNFRPYLIHFYSSFGLQGLFLGTYGLTDLIEAVDTVVRGNHFLRPELLKQMYNMDLQETYLKINSMTPTEQRVVACTLDGMNNDQIAEALGCQRRTAESHKYRAYKKLQVESSIDLYTFISDFAPWIANHSQVQDDSRGDLKRSLPN